MAWVTPACRITCVQQALLLFPRQVRMHTLLAVSSFVIDDVPRAAWELDGHTNYTRLALAVFSPASVILEKIYNFYHIWVLATGTFIYFIFL